MWHRGLIRGSELIIITLGVLTRDQGKDVQWSDQNSYMERRHGRQGRHVKTSCRYTGLSYSSVTKRWADVPVCRIEIVKILHTDVEAYHSTKRYA